MIWVLRAIRAPAKMAMTNGERVRQAREIRGMTQAELARLAGVNQSNIARVEAGTLIPSPQLMRGIALHTDFPLAFFQGTSGPDFPLGSLLYRRRSRLKSQERSQVRQIARLTFELYERLSGKFSGYDVRIPRLSEQPSLAAMITRSALGYSPDTPITELVRRLERNGVAVLSVPCAIHDHDAFSLWTNSDPRTPVIVLTAGKPGDRMRFSVAHELAHLVMHRTYEGTMNKLEAEADEFAAEFLLPQQVIKRELQTPITLSQLVELKHRWGVSMQALVMRATDLGVITERQRKYLFQQISSRGWRTDEPLNLPPEKPRLLRKMVELVYGKSCDVSRVAGLICGPVRLVEQVLDCYAGPPSAEPSDSAQNNLIMFRSLAPEIG
jgi:Zn-dependent peptidase ImmA (M78 family)/DNA-binding XRE family transcriptional regulator